MQSLGLRPARLWWSAVTIVALASLLISACAIVPQNRRKYLSDPTMQANPCPLETRAHRKLYTSREAASGGDGQSAGGGCGCGN